MENSKKIIAIVNEVVNSFEELNSYKFIGIIGSFIKEENPSGDLDVVSIGDSKVHARFKEKLDKKFRENGGNI